MSTTVPVKLTDQEWRTRCELLAKEELRRKAKRDQLEAEAEEWSARRKDLQGQIDTISDICETLAKEVDTREAQVDAQGELPLQEDAHEAGEEAGEEGA